jgi:cadmium resistance protein CadD (predicted permease)
MNALVIFIWGCTILCTAIVFLPFVPNIAGFQYHWGFRLAAVVLMALGWFLIFTNHTLLH